MSIFVTQQPLPYFVGGHRATRLQNGIPAPAAVRAFEGASPSTSSAGDNDPVNLGLEFYVTSAASLTHIHWWQPTTGSNASARSVGLFDLGATQVGSTVVGDAPAAPGWQTTAIGPHVLTPNIRYKAVVFHPGGGYAAAGGYFIDLPDITDGVLTVPGVPNATDNEQGTFNYSGALAFTDSYFNGGNYWVDVTVTA